MANGIELGNAYISINARTDAMAGQIKAALNGSAKVADQAGADLGKRLSKSASKAMKDGWRPDQDIMAGIPNTKLDRIGAHIGQVIGKGIGVGIRANEAGAKFAKGFQQGASSIGIGRLLAKWRAELTGGNALASMGALAGKTFAAGLTGAATLGIGALVGGVSLALSGGIKRLMSIDQAKFKLKGLGKSTQEISDIVKTVTESVTGTPFSLDEAFATATQAIGANVKDLKRFMTDVSDAAGFAGVDIGRMGLIFNQIQAKGKLSGEEMMQLMEAGLPAKSWIMESAKLTSDDFDKMQADGKITMEMLEKAIEEHAGGMSKKLGESLSGAIDNVKTAVARLGADFLAAIFGGDSSKATDTMADSINKISDNLNNMDSWVKTHGPEIQSAFKAIGSAIEAAFKGAKGVLDDFMGDMKLLATGLSKLFGGMATVDEFLNKIPGMGGNEQEAAKLREWQQSLATWGDPNPAPAGGGGSNGSHGGAGDQKRGALALPMPGQNPMGSVPSIAPLDTGGAAGAAWNPKNLDTGGAISPTNQAIENYLRTGLGFTGSIGGYRPPDGYNEHSSGHASDVMVQSPQEGMALLPNLLSRPGVKYILWNQQQWNPDGTHTPMADRGSPTQNHMDHLHVGTYDSGGKLKPGLTLAQNNTGQNEHVLTDSQLQDMRTAGYMPAAAGNMGKAGDSTIAKGIGIGGEVINGLIDQAASAAATAASAAATAGSFGAGGQAAGPAAAMAIGLGADAAKRGVTYGFDMLGIGADTLLQQVMPFGMPRWLSTDPGAFMPNQAITGALGNLLSQGAAQPANGAPGSAVDPNTTQHGMAQGAPPGISNLMDSTQPPTAGWFGDARHGTQAGNPPGPAPFENTANSFLSTELAQQGGSAPAANGQPTVSIGTVYAQDPNELSMQIQKRQNLAAMQYTGRPGP